MGAFQDIRAAIEARLSTNWTTTAIAWDNVEYNPSPATSFIRLIVDEVDSTQVSMATTPCHRIVGLIHIMIMVPINTGTNVARGYADTLAGYFRNADFSDIKCQSPRIRRVGDIGEYYQYSLLIPFYTDKYLANAT
jgi:hypothetical protein